MIELPIFICYRRDDGSAIAAWLHRALHGRSVQILERGVFHWATLSPYLDKRQPATSDWRSLRSQELDRAQIFLVVCSPGVAAELDDDEVYYELRWWLEHRRATAPLLVGAWGIRWIPRLVRNQWPHAQLVTCEQDGIGLESTFSHGSDSEEAIQSILAGIRVQMSGAPQIESKQMQPPVGLYQWEKDKGLRYINCNDNYAQAAGFDSPNALIGKTDDDMPWRSLAEGFRLGDRSLMLGQGPPRTHVQETEIMVDRVADILVYEQQLLNKRNECVGVTGYFADITGHQLTPKRAGIPSEKGINLGEAFGQESLSPSEADVLGHILNSESEESIAKAFGLSRIEVRGLIQSIKRKLQCATEGDIIVTATRSGLPLGLFGPQVTKEDPETKKTE